MLVVNTCGTLIHIILEDNKQKYRIPINGVTTDNTSQYHLMWSFLVKKKNPLNYNKKIKWLYK
jgi:hypothetical protein